MDQREKGRSLRDEQAVSRAPEPSPDDRPAGSSARVVSNVPGNPLVIRIRPADADSSDPAAPSSTSERTGAAQPPSTRLLPPSTRPNPDPPSGAPRVSAQGYQVPRPMNLAQTRPASGRLRPPAPGPGMPGAFGGSFGRTGLQFGLRPDASAPGMEQGAIRAGRSPFGMPNVRRNVCPHFYMPGLRGAIPIQAPHLLKALVRQEQNIARCQLRGGVHLEQGFVNDVCLTARFNQCVFYEDDVRDL